MLHYSAKQTPQVSAFEHMPARFRARQVIFNTKYFFTFRSDGFSRVPAGDVSSKRCAVKYAAPLNTFFAGCHQWQLGGPVRIVSPNCLPFCTQQCSPPFPVEKSSSSNDKTESKTGRQRYDFYRWKRVDLVFSRGFALVFHQDHSQELAKQFEGALRDLEYTPLLHPLSKTEETLANSYSR